MTDRILVHHRESLGAPTPAELRGTRAADADRWTATWRRIHETAIRIADGEGRIVEDRRDHEIVVVVLDMMRLTHWQRRESNSKVNRTLSVMLPFETVTLTTHVPDVAYVSDGHEEDHRAELAVMTRLGLLAMSALCGTDGHDIASQDDLARLDGAARAVALEVHEAEPVPGHHMGGLHYRTPLTGPLCILDDRDADDAPASTDGLPMAVSASLLGVSDRGGERHPRISLKPYHHSSVVRSDDPMFRLRDLHDLETARRPDGLLSALSWIRP